MHSIPTRTGGRATASPTLKVNNDFAGPGCPPVLKQKDALVIQMEQKEGGKERYAVLMEELAERAAAAKVAEEAAVAEEAVAAELADLPPPATNNYSKEKGDPEISIDLPEEISAEVVN